MVGKSAIVTMAREGWERAARPHAGKLSRCGYQWARTLALIGEAIRAWGTSALAIMGVTTVPWPAQPGRETTGRAILVSLAG